MLAPQLSVATYAVVAVGKETVHQKTANFFARGFLWGHLGLVLQAKCFHHTLARQNVVLAHQPREEQVHQQTEGNGRADIDAHIGGDGGDGIHIEEVDILEGKYQVGGNMDIDGTEHPADEEDGDHTHEDEGVLPIEGDTDVE